MPAPAAVAATLVALRLLFALNSLGDALMNKILYSRTPLARFCLLSAATPGCLAMYHYRGAWLAEDMPAASVVQGNGCKTGRLPTAVLVARNARRMPPAFWLTASISSIIALHVAKDASLNAIRRTFQTRLRVLLGAAALSLMAARMHKVASRMCARQTAALFAFLVKKLSALKGGPPTTKSIQEQPEVTTPAHHDHPETAGMADVTTILEEQQAGAPDSPLLSNEEPVDK